jgi:glycine/D-amino acid oxidase-like deaminating enzyme
MFYAKFMTVKEQPAWKNFSERQEFPTLKKDERADVLIVGGGLAGIITAYMLNKEGKDVAVLEKEKVGSGATEYTTAFITQDIDTDLVDLVKMYGEDRARMVWESHGKAIDLIEDIVKAEKIDCEFMRCPSFVYTISEDGIEGLEKEVETANKLGFGHVSLSRENFKFKNYGAMETKNQAKFHPLKFLYRLAEIVAERGVRVYEGSEAVSIEKHGEWKVTDANGCSVIAHDLIVATYFPFNNPKPTYFKKGMYVSYAFEAKLPKGQITEGLFWDDDNPYNYFRIDSLGGQFDRMVIGGQDHRKEVKMDPEKNYKALEDYMKEVFASVDYEIIRKWDGPILEPSDGLALIGETYPQQYVATAFSGNGMTYSGVAGMLLTDLIMKKNNPWAKIYDPRRVPSLYQLLKKGKDYTGEFFGGAGANIFKQAESTSDKKSGE